MELDNCRALVSNLAIIVSVTSNKLPNVYKSCPKNDSTRKMKDFDTFTKTA